MKDTAAKLKFTLEMKSRFQDLVDMLADYMNALCENRRRTLPKMYSATGKERRRLHFRKHLATF